MKNISLKLALAAILCIGVDATVILWAPGCTTPVQRKAFNTIATVETTATATMSAYLDLVIKGQVRTNEVPQVSRAYNSLQQSVKLAVDLAQSNTNALAPDPLNAELVDFLNLVTQAKGK